MLATHWPKGRLYARAVFAGLATFGAIFIPLIAPTSNAGAKVGRVAATSPPAAPAAGAQEVTGPVGTLPDGTFPSGVTVIAKLPELSTATSNTYLTSTGSRILMSYEGTVNYKDSNGHFQPIDDSALATSGGGFHNGANTYQANVPSSLTQPVSVTAGAATLSFSLKGASSGTAVPPALAPTVVPPTGVSGSAANDTVTFAKPLPSTDISYTFGPTGLAETLSLAASTAPDTYTWSLNPGAGLSAAKTPDGSIVITNATGATVMLLVAPTIEDANNLVGPPPTMSLSPDGTTVTLSLAPDAAWLADGARAFPVTIDPSINTNFAGGSECHIYQNAPTTPECASGTSYLVGYNGLSSNAHTMFRFDSLTSSVPYDSLVQNAYFNVYEQGALNSNSIPISLNSIANETWSGTSATWNYYAGTSSWVNPGGDFAPTPAAQAQNAGTANGWLQWDPVQQVQAWVNGADLTTSGNPASVNQGFMLTAPNGAANTISITNWRGSATTQYPYLLVTYTPRIGTGSGLTSLKTQIDDKTTLAVNAANGDLSVDTSLFNIKGVGLPLAIDQNYDSMGATQTSLGTSTQGAAWSLSSSFDQPLLVVRGYLSNIVIDLIASDGTNAVFSNQNADTTFPSPPGLNATLKPAAGNTFTLTFHPSGEVWTFSLIPGHYGAYFHLASVKDRNNDTITYNYDATTGTILQSVSDTEGRNVTVNYNSNNLVSSVVDSTGRTVSYTYSGSSGNYRLATASFGGSTTTYGYDSNGNLNEITDPIGNITTVGYNSSQQVTSVTRVTNNVTLAGDTTTYSYAPSSAGAPTTPGTTTATDPNAHATKYQYDPWDRVSKVTDANNNAESSTYNSQSSATQLTDAMASPGITTLSYDLNNNLTSITSPASGGSSASQTLGYSTPGTINGGTYLPSSNKDAQGNCTSYTYDTPGNLQGSVAGQGSSCTGAGTSTAANAYQGDGSTSCGGKTGELCSVTDGNGHVTTYGYDTNGEVTSVTPPSPQGTTTLTYDSLSRPHTVATPTGTATYTYDVWDRVTAVAYTSGPSLSYTYDADGNLKQRVDPSGTTTFNYDTLNRLTAEHLPSGADGCSGSLITGITLGYDAASNLTSYCDGAGTTTYGYDLGNRVTSLAEPGGSCSMPTSLCTTFSYDADNHRLVTTFPGGATLTAGYNPAGDQTSAVGKVTGGGTTLTSYAYSYANGTNQTQLRQSMTENDTSVANVTTNYGYSAQNQLLSATNTTTNTAQEFFYDPAGNRCNANTSSPPLAITSCASPSYTYNSADQLTSGPAGSYGYDSSGEEQSSPQLSNLTYNTAAQTTSITPTGMSAIAHSYADIGQSLLTVDGSTTLANGPLGLDRATTAGTNTYFIRDPGGNVIGESTGTSPTLYFLKDVLGSVTAAINGAGSTVSDRFSYDSYGNQTVVSGSTYEPIGYAGGYYNANIGLTKFGTRYYDSTTGRWTQLDPIGGSITNPNTLNGYIYTGDNPINGNDPTGRCNGFSIFSGIESFFEGAAAGALGSLLITLGGLLEIDSFGASTILVVSSLGLFGGAGTLFYLGYQDLKSAC